MNMKWLGFLVFVAAIFGTLWFVYDQDMDVSNPFLQSPQCADLKAVKGDQPFRFIAFGDFGAGTLFQRHLADEMARIYKTHPYHTVLLLGDNIYPNGDIAKLAAPNFEEPYHFLLSHQMRLIAALGNHDVKDNHKADGMRYFGMPNEYYKATQGPVDFFVLNTIDFKSNPTQHAWLDKELSESRAPWKFVMAHHPMNSSGRYGKDGKLTAQLLPILLRHHVDFYLNGHEHLYERFKPIQSLYQVTSGGGGAYLYSFKKIIPQSVAHARTHHFLLFVIQGKQLVMKTINKAGQVIDCVTVNKADAQN